MDYQQLQIDKLRKEVKELRKEVEELRSTAFWAELNVKWAEAFVKPIMDSRKKIDNGQKQQLVDYYFENEVDD